MSKAIEYDIIDLLPHDPPMILLDRVLEHRDDYIETAVTIQEGSPFCNLGIPIGVQNVDSETRVEARSVQLVREDPEISKVSKTHSLKHDGYRVPSYVAIEYMAQAIAAWNGLLSRKQGQKPRIGFLLGSRKLKLLTPCFKVGETLNVFGQSKYNDEEMASFDCWVERSGERVAEASLNVFQPKEGISLE